MNEHTQPLEQAQDQSLAAHDPPGPGPRPAAPEQTTGDAAIDAALRDLETTPADDLDAQAEAGRRLHEALQERLSDLGE